MPTSSRGPFLTTCAILFGLLAVSNFLKPFELGATTGFVFFGARLKGTWNTILGPLFGVFLAIYAAGIWRMKRYAVGMAHAYALYVILNLVMFNMRSPEAAAQTPVWFGVIYSIIAVGISLGAAITLTRRKAELT